MKTRINSCMYCNVNNVRILEVVALIGGSRVDGYAAYCDSCGARGPVKKTKQKAIKLWNFILDEIELLEDKLEIKSNL